MKRKLIFISLLVISAGLAVAGYIFLPDIVAMQINFRGEVSNSMPKLFAVLLPFILSSLTAYLYYKSEKGGYIAASVIGIAVSIFSFIFNIN